MIQALKSRNPDTLVPSVLQIITKHKLPTRNELNFTILILPFSASISILAYIH